MPTYPPAIESIVHRFLRDLFAALATLPVQQLMALGSPPPVETAPTTPAARASSKKRAAKPKAKSARPRGVNSPGGRGGKTHREVAKMMAPQITKLLRESSPRSLRNDEIAHAIRASADEVRRAIVVAMETHKEIRKSGKNRGTAYTWRPAGAKKPAAGAKSAAPVPEKPLAATAAANANEPVEPTVPATPAAKPAPPGVVIRKSAPNGTSTPSSPAATPETIPDDEPGLS